MGQCIGRDHVFDVVLRSVDLEEDDYQKGWKDCECGSLRARLGYDGHLQFQLASDNAGTTFHKIALRARLEEE